ncbi:DUF1353 domain-containing protein [Thiohalorhabdus sp.]|uniref:DUF1353 domain-containing protein n=1 Tax=Thiohalorhabdus sp. TaxID=3094134 RepID=UPI003FCDDC90
MASLVLRWEGDRTWRLHSRLPVVWRNREVAVPPGSRTDLASVPHGLRWLVSVSRVTRHLRIWWWGWAPFPYYKRTVGPVRLMLGWKSRGILSATIRRA